MKRVIVLDANQRSALAVTRSLGKRGVKVYTADETPSSLAGSSRYSSSYFHYPSPRTNASDFIEFLLNLVKTHNIGILFPMTELTSTLLLKHQSNFPKNSLPFPDMSTVDSLANKCQLMRTADSLHIPIPRTWQVENPTELPDKLDNFQYPLILKPGKSWIFTNKWNRYGVKYADSPLMAQKLIESNPAFQAHPFILQEYIIGSGQGVFALYDHGNPLAFFAHRRIREKPPRGGVSVLSESIPIDQTMLNYSRRLLDNANWHGVAMVEFKVDKNNGTPYLMEVNTRFWGSLQLAIDAGVDFPWLLYKLACDEQPEKVRNYRYGIRLRWLLGDFDNLYLTLRDQRINLRDKINSFLHFLKPSPFKTRHEVDRWGDLGPFRHELKQYIAQLFR